MIAFAPVVEPAGRWTVLRDDLVPGGTKRRFLPTVLAGIDCDELVYAGPPEGYAQLALGHVARDLGLKVHYFVAARNDEHPTVTRGRQLGVIYHRVRPGYLGVVEARAREFAAESPRRHLLPLGMHTAPFLVAAIDTLGQIAGEINETPSEVWIAAGSGLLASVLAVVFPCPIRAVAVGRPPKVPAGVTVYDYPTEFGKPSRRRPPYPSVANFDAKVWDIALDRAQPGALIWNVGS